MFSAYSTGVAGCYGPCLSDPRFAIDGSCYLCNGYCCRSDGYKNACSNDFMVKHYLPTTDQHYCLIAPPGIEKPAGNVMISFVLKGLFRANNSVKP